MTDEHDVNPAEEPQVPDQPEEATPAENSEDAAASAPETPVEESAAADASAEASEPADASVGVVNPGDVPEDEAEAAMLGMLNDLPEDNKAAEVGDISFDTGATAARAEFQQLQKPGGTGEPQNIELLLDVDLPVSIELGRTKMSIADILALGPGSVVELNKLAGEPVDLLVNQKVVAKGEVVVVDENFGLRVTQLMTPEERLKALAEE
ncbi:MAG: flagellar motor switch protein FliN [Candidatus Zixiibacteriota bacterium]|nr:MAG: flagellar motor switch protein FliN [candidate division Zixibacteria bacterium]